tara:strand:- start:292 stop:513 length:222 start_codon:yes stop_codon:yes gene_type:complete
MNSERINEILKNTAYPESKSVYQALLQVWNECQQDVMNPRNMVESVISDLDNQLGTNYSADKNLIDTIEHNFY